MRGKVNLEKWALCALFLLLATSSSAAGKIIYVEDDAAGTSDGSSWVNAYKYLQDALTDANSSEKPVEIRVAQGIYKPDRGISIMPGYYNATFQLLNGVMIQGGYAGLYEPEPNAVNIDVYKTILSGDLNDDDDPNLPSFTGNVLRVVKGSYTDETAVLNGFTITAGNWYAMENIKGSPVLSNCAFEHSRDGMRNSDGSNPVLTNCRFSNNDSSGMWNWDSSPILTGCTFENNKGSGMENSLDSSPTLTNCAFKSNSHSAFDHNGGSLTLTGCVFIGNSGLSGGGINNSPRGDLTLLDCTFTGNSASSGGAINSYGTLTLHNCTFGGNSASFSGGAINSSGNLVIYNCLFSGNSAERGGAIYPHGNVTRLYNCTFVNNSANGDWIDDSWLHYNEFRYTLTATNCIIWDDDSSQIDNMANISHSNVQGGFLGEGNISVDPLFVDPDNGDYHLKSQAGRWNHVSKSWVKDDVTSLCIDAGDPNGHIGLEPFPNGGRINMGAYGGTAEASKTYFGGPVCETVIAGDINGDCVVDFEDLMILVSHWMMKGEDFVNKPPTVRITEPQDGAQIVWPGPTMLRAEANDVDGEVSKVDFYLQYKTGSSTLTGILGGSKGADSWQREYFWTSSDAARQGSWTIWAEATDNEGTVAESPKIVVTLSVP